MNKLDFFKSDKMKDCEELFYLNKETRKEEEIEENNKLRIKMIELKNTGYSLIKDEDLNLIKITVGYLKYKNESLSYLMDAIINNNVKDFCFEVLKK